MAIEIIALASVTLAIAALLVTAAQLKHQLDRRYYDAEIGGLTRNRIWQWRWPQLRFVSKNQAVIMALPAPLYSALGIKSTVRVHTTSQDFWMKVMKPRGSQVFPAQSSWISFVQDLVKFNCIRPDDLAMEENESRIPEGLTVVPSRVDAAAVLLTSLAMGMKVFRYSPAKGEIALGGGVGGISSINHPILGCLLHYSFFRTEPNPKLEKIRMHAQALRHEKGVWANTVFGKFTDRSFAPDLAAFSLLRDRKMPILEEQDWPQNSFTDTLGGAACFMAFAHVDAYQAVPPSVVRPWCAHFAEIIVKAHHMEMLDCKTTDLFKFSFESLRRRKYFIEKHGSSSPYLPWEDLDHQSSIESTSEKTNLTSITREDLLRHLEMTDILAIPDPVSGLAGDWPVPSTLPSNVTFNTLDPSTYIPLPVAWEVLMRADHSMRLVHLHHHGYPNPPLPIIAEKITATAIASLSEAGAPSWKHVSKLEIQSFWTDTFPAACSKVLAAQKANEGIELSEERREQWEKGVRVYARLGILRAAYYTVMMRAAGEVGPGLREDSKIETALVYMV